ncbi:hypothetical protein CJP72_10555 [Citrobacter sp. NCU1]|nr:hypothetical protein [Citrobacter sp. NCU1]
MLYPACVSVLLFAGGRRCLIRPVFRYCCLPEGGDALSGLRFGTAVYRMAAMPYPASGMHRRPDKRSAIRH